MAKIGCQVFASHVLQSIHEDEAAIQDAIIYGYYVHTRSSGEGFSITREKTAQWLRDSGNPVKASFVLKELRREPASTDKHGPQKAGS